LAERSGSTTRANENYRRTLQETILEAEKKRKRSRQYSNGLGKRSGFRFRAF